MNEPSARSGASIASVCWNSRLHVASACRAGSSRVVDMAPPFGKELDLDGAVPCPAMAEPSALIASMRALMTTTSLAVEVSSETGSAGSWRAACQQHARTEALDPGQVAEGRQGWPTWSIWQMNPNERRSVRPAPTLRVCCCGGLWDTEQDEGAPWRYLRSATIRSRREIPALVGDRSPSSASSEAGAASTS